MCPGAESPLDLGPPEGSIPPLLSAVCRSSLGYDAFLGQSQGSSAVKPIIACALPFRTILLSPGQRGSLDHSLPTAGRPSPAGLL